MTAIDLFNTFIAAGLRPDFQHLADNYFEPVSAAWVQRNWDAWMAARPSELKRTIPVGGGASRLVPLWLEQSSDCDNLALGLMVHGQVGNALASVKRGTKRGGLAFGVVFYTAQSATMRGGHAINWFVGYGQELAFFEPGLGEIVELNSAERASARFCLAA